MGMTNSPVMLQRFMEYVFSDQIFVTLLVYLDDLLVFARSGEEHYGEGGNGVGVVTKIWLKVETIQVLFFNTSSKISGVCDFTRWD